MLRGVILIILIFLLIFSCFGVAAAPLIVPETSNVGFLLTNDTPISYVPGILRLNYRVNGSPDTAWPENGNCYNQAHICMPSNYAYLSPPEGAAYALIDFRLERKAFYPIKLFDNGKEVQSTGDWKMGLGHEASGFIFNMRPYGFILPGAIRDTDVTLETPLSSCSYYNPNPDHPLNGWITKETEVSQGYKVYKTLPYQTSQDSCAYRINLSNLSVSQRNDIRVRSLSTLPFISSDVFSSLPAGAFTAKLNVNDSMSVRYFNSSNQFISQESLFDGLELNLKILIQPFFEFNIIDGSSISLNFSEGVDTVVRGVSSLSIRSNVNNVYYSISCLNVYQDGRCALKNLNGTLLPIHVKFLSSISSDYTSGISMFPGKLYSNINDFGGAATLQEHTFGVLFELTGDDVSILTDKDGYFSGTISIVAESGID